jgi:hypothetical protein
MDRTTKGFSLLLVAILAVSSLILVESASAQSIPKPSVPEFTLKFVDHSYDVPPTYGIDQYTGKTVMTHEGYHAENKSIEIVIKNQPPLLALKLDNEHYAAVFYNISYKGHYGENWEYYSYNLETEYFLHQSEDSEYTTTSFKQIPSDGQIDFRVQAQVGYFTSYNMPWKVYVFHGETSGWSNIQTITIPEGSTSTSSPNPTPTSTQNPTPTATVPELSWLAILLLLASMLAVALLLKECQVKKL